jgi:glutaredoxin 3
MEIGWRLRPAMAKIEMFTTPFCGYCARAKALLDSKGAAYDERDVMMDDKARAEMRARTDRTSVPQIFIDGAHIGGSDELAALDAAGKLDPLLAR